MKRLQIIIISISISRSSSSSSSNVVAVRVSMIIDPHSGGWGQIVVLVDDQLAVHRRISTIVGLVIVVIILIIIITVAVCSVSATALVALKTSETAPSPGAGAREGMIVPGAVVVRRVVIILGRLGGVSQ